MTYHDHEGCHRRLARPCGAFTGGQAARGTRSHWSISSHQLPQAEDSDRTPDPGRVPGRVPPPETSPMHLPTATPTPGEDWPPLETVAPLCKESRKNPGRVCQPACKPGFVPLATWQTVTIIYLAPPLPAGSSSLPGDHGGPGRSFPLLGLAPGGVCRASRSPGCWCALTLRAEAPHRFTLTEESPGGSNLLPADDSQAVYFLLHCPARWRPVPGARNRYRGWALPTTAPDGARTFLPP